MLSFQANNMRKYVPFTITFAILAIFLGYSFTSLNAQTTDTTDQPVVIKDFDGLRAEFKQETQDPESKNATFNMILKSNIDSDRVKIVWTVTGSSKALDSKQLTMNLNIKKGGTYTVPITVIPQGEGVTEVYGTAQSVSVDSSFLVTVRKNFQTNKLLEILPLTDAYNQAKTLSNVKNIVIVLVIVSIIIGILFVAFKRFNRYIKTEPEVTFDNEVDPNITPAGK